MYNKLSVSYKKRHLYCFEDEPPEKKLVSDCDVLIKQLSEKQRNTEVNLDEQLSAKSQFYKSTEVVSVTNFTSGATNLKQFNSVLQHMNQQEQLKSSGLSCEDIQLINDYQGGKELMQDKHKNLNPLVGLERLNNIFHQLKQFDSTHKQKTQKLTELKTETTLALKPDSLETKLLKFAIQNQTKKRSSGPMDEIKEVEQKLIHHLLPANIKKIRKKSRKFAKQIEKFSNPTVQEVTKGHVSQKSLCAASKWDLKVYQPEEQRKNCEVFTCKPQNYYTIRNGEIVMLNSSLEMSVEKKQDIEEKLSIEEIRENPKFKDYEKGIPSNILYLKNLANGVQERDLEHVLREFSDALISVNILKGRMHGQAFLEFKNEAVAEKVLDKCNGLVLQNKPIIIQFGKQKCTQIVTM